MLEKKSDCAMCLSMVKRSCLKYVVLVMEDLRALGRLRRKLMMRVSRRILGDGEISDFSNSYNHKIH